MLEFEHIIQINDPKAPSIPYMSKAQLWEGLVFRARCPAHFTPNIDCTVEHVDEGSFVRVLRFGEQMLRERVHLIHEAEVRTGPADEEPIIFAQSVARIEEPAPGHLIVRFIYRRESGNTDGNLDVDEYLKSAYVQNDREAISILRKMAHGSNETPN